MEPSKTLRRDILQNVLIVLLTLSAFLQLYLLLRPANSGGSLRRTVSAPEAVTELASVSAPLRLAVTVAYGRYGDLSLTTTDEAFSGPGSLLREALGSAGTPQDCREEDFRAALSAPSVYYDFENVLPLSVAAGLVGADAPVESSVRQLVLSAGEDGVELYLTDGVLFHRCATKVAPASLEELISGYQPGGAAFAYELGENTLAPYTLLLTEELPAYPELSVLQDAAGDADALLAAAGFNPSTKTRYTESNGTQVIGEGDRTLRIHGDGTVEYDGGADDTLSVSAAGEVPTAREAVLGSFQLLSRFLPNGGALALQSVQPVGEDGWTLTFDYQVNGVPVRFSSGSPAAQVELQGLRIARFTLCPRQYLPGTDTSRLLPLTQALAIARPYEGRELNICYIDTGADTISTDWLAE